MAIHPILTNWVLVLTAVIACVATGCSNHKNLETGTAKPTICVLGGTPSSLAILDEIPPDIRDEYHVISFNRPGFGGSENSELNREKLIQLAKDAGLERGDFGIIGISGGAPWALLIADELQLQHCGVISGMVSEDAYFAHANSTVTEPLMTSVLGGFEAFKDMVASFPNVDDILRQANSPREMAIRASFDDLSFALSKDLYPNSVFQDVQVDWWHGEADQNVAIESARLFLQKFKRANLHSLPNESHAIDSSIYVRKLIQEWGSSAESVGRFHTNFRGI